MFDHLNKPAATAAGGNGLVAGETMAPSLRQKRIARKKARADRHRKVLRNKSLSRADISRQKRADRQEQSGPTAETRARLTPDPLWLFKKKNILNSAQIWAFQRIRRAINIITEGSRVRICRFNDVVVDQCYSGSRNQDESAYEIRLKDHYSHWIDRMTAARYQAGPVLDIIIEEMSLSAVDRKWGKRKGWAKGRLQAALDLYQAFSPVS